MHLIFTLKFTYKNDDNRNCTITLPKARASTFNIQTHPNLIALRWLMQANVNWHSTGTKWVAGTYRLNKWYSLVFEHVYVKFWTIQKKIRQEKWMNIWLPYVIWSVGRRKVQNKYFQHKLIKVLKEFSINILTRRRVWKNLRHKQYYQSFNCVLNIKIFHCTHVINEQSKSELPLFSFCTYTKYTIQVYRQHHHHHLIQREKHFSLLLDVKRTRRE